MERGIELSPEKNECERSLKRLIKNHAEYVGLKMDLSMSIASKSQSTTGVRDEGIDAPPVHQIVISF